MFCSLVVSTRGRLICAFDATYITATLNQAEINQKRGLVGGVFDADHPEQCFVPLEGDHSIDISTISKSSSMLEFVAWEPTAPKKTPMSLLSLPIEVQFGGSGAESRGNYYMASLIGKFMEYSNGTIKALVCDNHSTHQVLRRCMHGQLSSDEAINVLEIPWFGKLHHSDVPANCLPRFPMRIAHHGEDIVYMLTGVCPLVSICFHTMFPFFCTLWICETSFVDYCSIWIEHSLPQQSP